MSVLECVSTEDARFEARAPRRAAIIFILITLFIDILGIGIIVADTLAGTVAARFPSRWPPQGASEITRGRRGETVALAYGSRKLHRDTGTGRGPVPVPALSA